MSSRLLTAREAAAILRWNRAHPAGDGEVPCGTGVVPLLVPLSTADVLGLARAVEADWAARWAAWAREAA